MPEQLSLFAAATEPTPVPELPPCHCCHAIGCNVPVSLSLLMCGRHWRLVPKDLQRQVWAHYRSGQEEDKQPSPEYMAAARAAISHVYVLENPAEEEMQSAPIPTIGSTIAYQGRQMQVYFIQPSTIWLTEAGSTSAKPYPWPEPPVGPQVLEPPVIEPAPAKSTGFLVGDQVTITGQIQGRGDCSFTPWQNRTGIYCGLNPVGLALVDFGIPGLLYPTLLSNLSHE